MILGGSLKILRIPTSPWLRLWAAVFQGSSRCYFGSKWCCPAAQPAKLGDALSLLLKSTTSHQLSGPLDIYKLLGLYMSKQNKTKKLLAQTVKKKIHPLFPVLTAISQFWTCYFLSGLYCNLSSPSLSGWPVSPADQTLASSLTRLETAPPPPRAACPLLDNAVVLLTVCPDSPVQGHLPTGCPLKGCDCWCYVSTRLG